MLPTSFSGWPSCTVFLLFLEGTMQVYAGIDWSRRSHAVCLIDEAGKIVLEKFFEHSRLGLLDLVRQLQAFGRPKVAIELTRGSVVELLTREGFVVMSVHPNHLAHARGCFGASGSKSDRKDAMVLAEVARTSVQRLREAKLPSHETQAVKRLNDRRRALMEANHRACQQLGHLLAEVFPAAVDLFSSVDCGISLAFLKTYPTARLASALTERRVSAFLKQSGYSGHTTAATFIERLEAGAPAVAATVADELVVRQLVEQVLAYQQSLKEIETEIERALQAHPDRAILASLPRVQAVTIASLIAALGNLEKYPTSEALAAAAGVVPVVKQSGQSRFTQFRHACNKELRHALTILANNSRQMDPWADSIYAAARKRGRNHPHALRILARAWTAVLFRMLKDRTTYDPSRHRRKVA
jgi:transposase